jgi:dinuclear metal center YbgI/SA1388 family protein
LTLSVYQLAAVFEELWPLEGADAWDAPGFSISHPNEVSKVLLSVDLSSAVVNEAIHKGAQLILTHHPFLLKGTPDVNWDSSKGSVLQQAIKAGISVYSAHTNADIVEDGVSDILAKSLGLTDIRPLVPTDGSAGHGRIGVLSNAMTLEQFATRVLDALPFTARGVSVSGYPELDISTVALCAGAGDSFIQNAFDSGADVYLTSDLRHHPVSDAISIPRAEAPMALIDISHWAAESLWLTKAAEQLGKKEPAVEFMVSEVVTDPWTFTINRGER